MNSIVCLTIRMVKLECVVHGLHFIPGKKKYYVTECNYERLDVTFVDIGKDVCQSCYKARMYPNDGLNKRVTTAAGPCGSYN